MVDPRNMPVGDLIRSLLQSEEEFAGQRSDLPFGTVMTKLQLFHVIERKCTLLDKLSR